MASTEEELEMLSPIKSALSKAVDYIRQRSRNRRQLAESYEKARLDRLTLASMIEDLKLQKQAAEQRAAMPEQTAAAVKVEREKPEMLSPKKTALSKAVDYIRERSRNRRQLAESYEMARIDRLILASIMEDLKLQKQAAEEESAAYRAESDENKRIAAAYRAEREKVEADRNALPAQIAELEADQNLTE